MSESRPPVVRKDGTVILDNEHMGRVTKDFSGKFRFLKEGSYSWSTRAFVTKAAAVNALIFEKGGSTRG